MTINELKDELNKLDENKIKELAAGLDEKKADSLYRALWCNYVKEDVKLKLEEESDIKLTENEIDNCVDLYVYHGKYDCDLSYWDNIQNLIEDVWEDSENNPDNE